MEDLRSIVSNLSREINGLNTQKAFIKMSPNLYQTREEALLPSNIENSKEEEVYKGISNNDPNAIKFIDSKISEIVDKKLNDIFGQL